MPQLPPRHAGRVVDPSVADDDDDSVPIEQMSEEPPEATVAPGRESAPSANSPIADEPSLRPNQFPPMPLSEVLLDPHEAPPPIPTTRRRHPTPSVLSPAMTAVFGALFGLAGLFAVFALLHRFAPHPTPGTASALPAARSGAPATAPTTAPVASAPARVLPNLDEDEGPALPGPWRIASLESDENVRIVSGAVGLDAFVNVLQDKKISKKETYRILAAFKGFDTFKRLRKSDKFVVAIDKTTGRVKAFELESGPFDVYQAKEDESGLLVGAKLDMKIGDRQRSTAVRASGETLADDLRAGRLRESVTSVIDTAFDGRASVSSMPKNSSLRVILREKTALGRFASYDYVEALEYVSSKQDAKPLRLYRFQDGNRFGYFDQRGREPFRGGWRRPCPGAPVTSNFNPKRMHPVLHVIKPHQGTDFGAPSGTPVHATSYGTIKWVGPSGPAGNLVIIEHPAKLESYYMHLSRFADGLSKGEKVETFQIIGYVGNTGRSTGPHLHFGIKRAGVWIDPMSLKLDGDRLVSAAHREEFDKVRAQYDALLDAIPLPPPFAEEAAPPVAEASATAPPEGDMPADEPPGSSPAAPPEASTPHPASTGENYDDEELEPEGFRDPRDRPDPKPPR